jgi:hypothetical protein
MVPEAARIAALNRSNDAAEVFAISLGKGSDAGDALFMRGSTELWTPWLPVSLPLPDAELSDVAAVGGQGRRSRVYIVDRGRVFVRERVSKQATSDYGPWRGLTSNHARYLSAARRSDGSHVVVTATESGELWSAAAVGDGASFSPWQRLAARIGHDGGSTAPPAIVDLDIADGDPEVTIFALDGAGILWSTSPSDSSGSWRQLNAVDPRFTVVSAAIPADTGASLVYGLDADGALHLFDWEHRFWDFLVPP